MEKILFLDFDGVLFDTVEEAYQVCINTNTFRKNFLPENSLNLFKQYRYLVGPAWNYYDVMHAIVNKIDLKENHFFINSIEAKDFENDFFSTRKKIKNDDYNNWLRSNKIYTFLDKLKTIVTDDLGLYIITTKDKQTVIDLLNEENIKFIKHDNILGKDNFNTYGSKKQIILNILQDKSYDAIFIDDLSSHLEPCEDINNLQLIQPDWGYIGINHQHKYLKNIDETVFEINKLKEQKL